MRCWKRRTELTTGDAPNSAQCRRCEQAGSRLARLGTDNAIVASVMRDGGTPEQCIEALCSANRELLERVSDLASIAPRKITLPDGRVMVWRCPDELVPELPPIPGIPVEPQP